MKTNLLSLFKAKNFAVGARRSIGECLSSVTDGGGWGRGKEGQAEDFGL